MQGNEALQKVASPRQRFEDMSKETLLDELKKAHLSNEKLHAEVKSAHEEVNELRSKLRGITQATLDALHCGLHFDETHPDGDFVRIGLKHLEDAFQREGCVALRKSMDLHYLFRAHDEEVRPIHHYNVYYFLTSFLESLYPGMPVIKQEDVGGPEAELANMYLYWLIGCAYSENRSEWKVTSIVHYAPGKLSVTIITTLQKLPEDQTREVDIYSKKDETKNVIQRVWKTESYIPTDLNSYVEVSETIQVCESLGDEARPSANDEVMWL